MWTAIDEETSGRIATTILFKKFHGSVLEDEIKVQTLSQLL